MAGCLICDLHWVTTSCIVMASSLIRPVAQCWYMDPNDLWQATTAVPTFDSSTFDFQSRTIIPMPCLVLWMFLLLDDLISSVILSKPMVCRSSRLIHATPRVVKHVHGIIYQSRTAGGQMQSFTSTALPWTESIVSPRHLTCQRPSTAVSEGLS